MNNLKDEIVLNGVKTKIVSADLDGDGVTGGVEKIQQKVDNNIVPVKEPTELGEVMNIAFPSKNSNSTKMLGNIHIDEEAYILLFLMLDKLDVLPTEATFIAVEKLLITPSRNARGRNDVIDISAGKTERDSKMSLGGKIGNFMGFGNKDGAQ